MSARLNNDLRTKILASAARLTALRGTEGMTLGDVARDCGVSKGTLYYYFKSREELLAALANACVSELGERLFAWKKELSASVGAGEAAKGLAGVFFGGGPQRTRLFAALLSCPDDAAASVCRAAADEWRIVIELAAPRLSDRLYRSLSMRAGLVLPLAVGLAAADGEGAEEAFAALLA